MDSQIGSFIHFFTTSLIKSLHGRYLQIMEAEGLEISQPALDSNSQDIHHGITRRQPAKRAHKYEPHVFCFELYDLQDFLVGLRTMVVFIRGYMTIFMNPQQVLGLLFSWSMLLSTYIAQPIQKKKWKPSHVN